MRLRSYILLLIIVLASCHKEIDVNMEDGEPRLVLNCLLEPGRPIWAHLSQTVKISSDSISFIATGRVELWVNHVFVEEMVASANGFYAGSHIVQSGQVYTLKASADGFPGVSATDTLPNPVSILAASSSLGSFFYENEGEIIPGYEFKTLFNDPLEKNQYQLMFIEKQESSNQTAFIRMFISCHVPDPVFALEDYFGYDPRDFVFSDQCFNGEQKEVVMKMQRSQGQYAFPSAYDALGAGNYTVLRTVSSNWYLFVKSWIRHYYNLQASATSDFDLIGVLLGIGSNPTPLYSNVENGHGLVAGFSEVVIKTELIDLRK